MKASTKSDKLFKNIFVTKITNFSKNKTHRTFETLHNQKSFNDDEYMINLVTTSDEFDVNDFIEFAKQIDNRIVSIYHTINDNISDAVIVDKLELLYGKEYLTEKNKWL